MKRTVVWSAALAVMLLMVGVAWFSAATTTRVQHAALVVPFSKQSLGAASRFQAPLAIPPPPGGISRDQAIAIAMRGTILTRDALESAVVGIYGSYVPGIYSPGSSRDELVWVVTFRGVFITPCPAGLTCPPMHHAGVVLDYYTGTILVDFDKP